MHPVFLHRAVRTTCLLALAVACALTAPASAGAVDVTALERNEVRHMNDFRAIRGLSRLKIDVTLTRTAEWMARDMPAFGYFGHTDHLGRDPFQRLARLGYPSDTWRGENLAAGYPDAWNTFLQWKNSPPHKANMLNAHYRAVGIALKQAPGSTYEYYWVTEFGSRVTRRVPSLAELNRFAPEQRTQIRQTARACQRMRRHGSTWQRMNCRWNVRTAYRLALT